MSNEDAKPPVKKEWYKFISPPDVPETPNKDTKASSIWRGFKDRTTAHGVPHVDKASGSCKVSFWCIVTLACLGMLGWQTSSVSIRFWNWKVDVVVKLAHKRELTFPAVTLCNTNPLKLSTLHNNTELAALLITPSSRRRRAIAQGMDVHCHHTNDPYCHQHRIRRSSTSSFDIEEQTMEILATMTEAEKLTYGYDKSEIFLDCRYAGSNCQIDKFTTFFDQNQGTCFTFNSGWNTSNKVETSKRAGRRHGLQLALNIHQEEYVDDLAQGAGMRIVIHPQDRMPFPSDEGVLATPGQLTSIGVRQVYVSRLGKQYGNCTQNGVGNITKNVYEQFYPVNYSSNACYKTCYQKYVIDRCGCADPQYPTHGEAFGDQQPQICHTDNTVQSSCKSQVSTEYQNNDLKCDCPVTCIETAYNFEVSSVEWPSNVNEENVLTQYSSEIPLILAANDTSEELRRNLLKLEIYFQEFNYETIEERPNYKPENYASDLGGILGLWIGCSVLSIFEFFELAADLMVLSCFKCCKKCSRKHKPTPASRQKSDTIDLVNSSRGSTPSSEDSRSGQQPFNAGGRRIKKTIPDTPPPPYTSTENLKSTFNNRTTRLHGHGISTIGSEQNTLKYV